jgi:hypothetical protein
MRETWAALTVHPHTLAVGDARLQAERLAFLARRNSTESLFSALQVGHHLGTDGANRTRSPKQATAHTLIDLALLLRNAYMLASLRIEHGEFPETPPRLSREQWGSRFGPEAATRLSGVPTRHAALRRRFGNPRLRRVLPRVLAAGVRGRVAQ